MNQKVTKCLSGIIAAIILMAGARTQVIGACASNLYADADPFDSVYNSGPYYDSNNATCYKILGWTKQKCYFGWWYEGLKCDSSGSPSYTQTQKSGTVGWVLGVKYCTGYGQPYDVTIYVANAADC
jgi:hypothetical protein